MYCITLYFLIILHDSCNGAGLIDSHGSVVAAATSALRQALSEDKQNKNNQSNPRTASGSNQQNSTNKGAALLFEVAFSAELPEQKRHPVAAALLKVLKQIQVSFMTIHIFFTTTFIAKHIFKYICRRDHTRSFDSV